MGFRAITVLTIHTHTMCSFSLQAGRSKRLRAMVPLEPGETVLAKVLVAKPKAKWAVAVSDDGQGRLFVLQVCCVLL